MTLNEPLLSPEVANAGPLAAGASRFASVDALRGFVMLTMLFVNDVSGVTHLPWWMKHFDETGNNGMTFVDWVFGGFLFVVGVSIPLAFANRLKRGEPTWKLALHILTRTLGLLLLGVLMVNGEDDRHPDPIRMGFSAQLWQLILYSSALLAFLSPISKNQAAKVTNIVLRVIGFAGLTFVAVTYRTDKGEWLALSWWGILGLIGWAYLVASIGYLVLRKREWLVAATFLLMAFFMFDHTDFFGKPHNFAARHLPFLHWLHNYLNYADVLGSQPAITMAGVVLGSMLLDQQMTGRQRRRDICTWGFILAISAVLFYPFYLLNKNNGTPTWCFICAAVTCWLWALFSWLIDERGIVRPLKLFINGGQNVLFAYLFVGVVCYFIWWRDYSFYDNIGHHSLAAGITRSLALAVLVLWLAGFVKDRGGRLRL